MIKARFKESWMWVPRIMMSVLVEIICLNAESQIVAGGTPRFDLPQINSSLEFQFDNLFRENDQQQMSDQKKSNKHNQSTDAPMQLVGTVIMGENKIAWIKINKHQIYVLKKGQHVPGSELRINRIETDSVELVNLYKCHKNSTCKPGLTLDLN